METTDELTFAQESILKKIQEKGEEQMFQDYGNEDYYDTDYNECHGDYYDAE